MQAKTRLELHQSFLDFIGEDVQRERHASNRRMLSVLVWCFLLPSAVTGTILLLVGAGVLPRNTRQYLDWLTLLFPVSYSLYVLSSEVLVELPQILRRGGVAHTLSHGMSEQEWRDRTCHALRQQIPASREEWAWIAAGFAMDLERLRDRTRYITALAGAVFFLIMQGLDWLGDPLPVDPSLAGLPPGFAQIAALDKIPQWVGLALFLTLLYLSGNQTSRTLIRYLNCARLIELDLSTQQHERDAARTAPAAVRLSGA